MERERGVEKTMAVRRFRDKVEWTSFLTIMI